MKVKRFNESIDPNISILEDAFLDISDNYEMIIENRGKNLYSVRVKINSSISEVISSIEEISSTINLLNERSKLMSTIKQSIMRTGEIEKFSIMFFDHDSHCEAQIIIDFGGDSSFYSLDESGILTISRSRIKSVLKDKFKVDLHDIVDGYEMKSDEFTLNLDFEDMEADENSEPTKGIIKFLMQDTSIFKEYSILGRSSDITIYLTNRISEIEII